MNHNFYLVGVVANDEKRKERLRENQAFDDATFDELDKIDAGQENVKFGQKSVKTVLLADYFFQNNYSTKSEILEEADRFLRLVFRMGVVTPRQDEYGMCAAYNAAKRSGCLSRQVGAAITSKDGSILATGRNDVPKFGGGLYTCDSLHEDKRCWAFGAKCYNDAEKQKIIDDLTKDLTTTFSDLSNSIEAVKKIIENSRVGALIEFSRSVHAEMDAIVNIARNGITGIVGSVLYCTTYPCHHCAKHIVDSGVKRVVYYEPYEKSLAIELHSDSINSPLLPVQDSKLRIELYSGVAANRYQFFFDAAKGSLKKADGKFKDKEKNRTEIFPADPMAKDLLGFQLDSLVNEMRKPKEKKAKG